MSINTTITPVRCLANLEQWEISRLVGQQIQSMALLTRLTCSLQCKTSGHHRNNGPASFFHILGHEKNQILMMLVLIFFMNESKLTPCLV